MRHSLSDTKIFLRGAFLFSFPLILLFGFPFAVFWYSGEFTSLAAVIDSQQHDPHPALFGRAYSNPDKEYKLRLTLVRSPEVVALGTSRVMQFRESFFKSGTRFTNAGGAIVVADDFKKFLDELPAGHEPKVIIVGLDPRFFNPAWDTPFVGTYHNPSFWTLHEFFTYGWRQFYSDMFHGKMKWDHLLPRAGEGASIGINARMNHDGFRSDGSYYYGKFLGDPLFPERTREEIKSFVAGLLPGSRAVEYGREVSGMRLDSLDRFLQSAAKRHIAVVGFLPPHSRLLYDKIQSFPPEFRKSFTDLPISLRGLFAAQGFSFYDFSDVRSIGSSDDELIDVAHGSEKMYARVIIEMAQRDSGVAAFVDAASLQGAVNHASSSFEILPSVW